MSAKNLKSFVLNPNGSQPQNILKTKLEHLKQHYKQLYDMIDFDAEVYELSPLIKNIGQLDVKDNENFILVGKIDEVYYKESF